VPPELATLPRPIMAYMGRLAVEKNVEAFLRLQLPGSKLVIGNGPQREELIARYPQAVFSGYRFGAELQPCSAVRMCSSFRAAPILSGLR
jgi:hypothetical protein